MKLKVLIMSMLLAGTCCCSVNPSKIGKVEAGKFVDRLTYVKDKRVGLCFAIIASRKTWDTDSSGLAITEVPCDKVDDHLE